MLEIFPSDEIFSLEKASINRYWFQCYYRVHFLCSVIISLANFQNNSFVSHIISSKNLIRTFLLLEPDYFFFFILFYVSHGTPLCTKFHDRLSNNLWREESQENHRSGCIKISLASLTQQIITTYFQKRAEDFSYQLSMIINVRKKSIYCLTDDFVRRLYITVL